MPAVMHGADHIAVKAFIEKKIGFMDIPKLITKTLEKVSNISNPSIEQIIEAEKQCPTNGNGDFIQMISVVITAAGNSTRFGGKIKTPTSIWQESPLVVRTVEQFVQCPKIDEIVVAARKLDFPLYEDLFQQHGLDVALVEGGLERIETIYNGAKATKGSIILTHDGARP